MKRTKSLDEHIGRRMRERREMLGMSQGQLAARVGVTYQQHYKREAAINRISAADLWLTARALGVGVGYFFEGFESGSAAGSNPANRVVAQAAQVLLEMPPERQVALAKVARLVRDGDEELGR